MIISAQRSVIYLDVLNQVDIANYKVNVLQIVTTL